MYTVQSGKVTLPFTREYVPPLYVMVVAVTALAVPGPPVLGPTKLPCASTDTGASRTAANTATIATPVAVILVIIRPTPPRFPTSNTNP